jgi:hypothetical protein
MVIKPSIKRNKVHIKGGLGKDSKNMHLRGIFLEIEQKEL